MLPLHEGRSLNWRNLETKAAVIHQALNKYLVHSLLSIELESCSVQIKKNCRLKVGAEWVMKSGSQFKFKML